MKWTYFWIDLLTLVGPLALSFDKRVAFFKNLKFILPAIIIPGFLYLVWDFFFTRVGVWEFNPKFITGHYVLNLPWEELAFFFCIPYACLFIYECLRVYLPNLHSKTIALVLGWCTVLLCLWAIYNYHNYLYTSVTAVLLLITLLNHLLVTRGNYLGYTFVAWLISILPMLVVNGLLTSLPILIYNNEQNTQIRLGTIPIEDFFYNLLLMIWVIWIYERKRHRVELKSSKSTG